MTKTNDKKEASEASKQDKSCYRVIQNGVATMTQNEILSAVDELKAPMLILTPCGEALVYPDSDEHTYALEYLEEPNSRVYNIDYVMSTDKNAFKTVTVLDWFVK